MAASWEGEASSVSGVVVVAAVVVPLLFGCCCFDGMDMVTAIGCGGGGLSERGLDCNLGGVGREGGMGRGEGGATDMDERVYAPVVHVV